MAKKKQTIFEAQAQAKEYVDKVFTDVNFKFCGETEEDIKTQMDKVYHAIGNAWFEGWSA
tara:strand:- start:1252 stop:1431 length:180 start_codon:yes stop_codon:yes gene_type:complete